MRLMHPLRNERGAAMVTTLLTTVVVSMLATVSTTIAVHNAQQSSRSRERVTAVHAAEAGVDWAIEQMSLINGNTCAWASAPPSLSANAAPGQASFSVQVTDSNPTGGCGDSATDLQRYIRSTGVDGNGPARVVVAEIVLDPVYATGSGDYSFNDAIFAGEPDNLLVASGIRLTGEGGDNADIYTAFEGNGSSASTRTTFAGSADIRGDAVVRGGAALEGSAQIRGDLWANGNVVLSGGTVVHGNVLARGNVSLSGSARIYGWVRATGSITTAGGSGISGARTPNDATVPVPPDRDMPAAPTSFNRTDWPQPYHTMTCTQFNDSHNTYYPVEPSQTNRNNFKGTYFITGSCAANPGGSSHTYTLTGDAAIVAEGCIEMGGSGKFQRPSGSDYELWMVSLKDVTSNTSCTGGAGDNRGIKLAGGAWMSSVPTFLFAENQVEVTGGVTIWGQIMAGRVKVAGGFGLSFKKMGVPGFSLATATALTGYTPNVLYVRQVDS